jgi:2-iminoacetate synthase ThiH
MFAAARHVKNEIYGNRLVLFAPLYISNLCSNECVYCAFRARNQELVRRALTQEEIATETRLLIEQGHKRMLLVWPAKPIPRRADSTTSSRPSTRSTKPRAAAAKSAAST